jgi:2-isopropylmalate synthase
LIPVGVRTGRRSTGAFGLIPVGVPMTRARLHLYDTTLRDGQQTQGVQFSTPEKIRIAEALDALGIDYIEGGWPGANPTDSAFFDAAPKPAPP